MPGYRLIINRADKAYELPRQFTAATDEAAIESARTRMSDYLPEDMAVLTDVSGRPITPLRGR